MKIFQCKVKATGKILNSWTSQTGDISYREPCFDREGEFEVIELDDFSERIQKLSELRVIRNGLLTTVVDVEVNNCVLGESAYSANQIKVYRQALKDITTPYKNWSTDSESSELLDALVVADFVWPTIG